MCNVLWRRFQTAEVSTIKKYYPFTTGMLTLTTISPKNVNFVRFTTNSANHCPKSVLSMLESRNESNHRVFQ